MSKKKSRAELEAKLKEVWPEFEIKADHNNSDLELFIEHKALLEKADKLEKELTKLKGENKKLKSDKTNAESEEIEGLKSIIEELNAQLADAQKTKGSNIRPEIKVGQHTYIVKHGIRSAKGIHTPSDIAENETLAKKLIEQNSSALQIKNS